MVWSQPLVVENATDVHIALQPEENGDVHYDIYRVDDASGARIAHSQGQIALLHSEAEAIPSWDIAALQHSCTGSTIDQSECYEAFQAMGLVYGPGHRAVQGIYVNQDQLLAELSLSGSVRSGSESFMLHPGMLDSALQASVGFLLHEGQPLEAHLPFALEQIDVFKPSPAEGWVVITRTQQARDNQGVEKLDMDLCDRSGAVCVRIRGFSARVMASRPLQQETVLLLPVWQSQSVPAAEPITVGQRYVVFCEASDTVYGELAMQLADVPSLLLSSSKDTLPERFEDYSVALLEHLQSIQHSKAKEQGATRTDK